MSEDRCVCCGEIIPEGRWVCPICELGRNGEGGIVMPQIAQSIIVSYTCGDDSGASLLLVGQKQQGKDVVIVNALQGEEANELWKKLTVKKEEN